MRPPNAKNVHTLHSGARTCTNALWKCRYTGVYWLIVYTSSPPARRTRTAKLRARQTPAAPLQRPAGRPRHRPAPRPALQAAAAARAVHQGAGHAGRRVPSALVARARSHMIHVRPLAHGSCDMNRVHTSASISVRVHTHAPHTCHTHKSPHATHPRRPAAPPPPPRALRRAAGGAWPAAGAAAARGAPGDQSPGVCPPEARPPRHRMRGAARAPLRVCVRECVRICVPA